MSHQHAHPPCRARSHQRACPLANHEGLGLISVLDPSPTMQGRIFLDRSGTLFDEVLSLLSRVYTG